MKQNKLDKSFKEAGKAMEDTRALCGQIQGKLADIREKLIAYRERRRHQHAHFMDNVEQTQLLALLGLMLTAKFLESYIPAPINTGIWIAFLIVAVAFAIRRFFRKAY